MATTSATTQGYLKINSSSIRDIPTLEAAFNLAQTIINLNGSKKIILEYSSKGIFFNDKFYLFIIDSLIIL